MEYVKILGAPSATATTQTHELELSDGGTLFLLITLHSPEPSLTRIEAIRGAVNFLHHEVSKQAFNFEAFGQSIEKTLVYPQFEAVCAYVKDSVVYVFAIGNCQAFLTRNGKVVPLVTGGKSVQSVSGYLKGGDSLLLITNSLLQISSVAELTPYLTENRLSALEADTATRIQASEERGECGLLCLSDQQQKAPTPDTLEEAVLLDTHATEEAEIIEEEPEEVSQPVMTAEPVDPVHEHPVFVREENMYEAKRKSKRLAYIGVVLLVLLGVSIYFGNKARKAKAEAAAVGQIIADAQQSLNEAKSIASVNKSRARELITNAREQVLGVHTEAKYPELLSIKDALTQSLGDVAGVFEITPTIFSDLSLISQNTKANALSISDNLVRVLSSDDKRVVTIELPGKRTETLSGASSITGASDIATYTKRTFVLASDGVYDVSTTAKKQIDLPAGQGSLLFASFANNLYLVDKSQNQIWRYSGDGETFGEKKDWLSEGTSVDFSKAVNMGIDGSIWVYSSSGRLVKFTLGNPQIVPLKGLNQSLSERTIFFTDSDSESLYFLDPDAKSIFVFDKTGELIAVYSDTSLSQAQKFVVSEQSKLMIYSVGSKLYSLPVQHIK